MLKRVFIVLVLLLVASANIYSPLQVSRMHVEMRPETLWQIGAFKITNSLVGSWLAMILLVGISLLATRRLVEVPAPGSLQNLLETILELLHGFMQGFAGPRTRAFFPVTATFFLYILTCNWLALLPGFGSIGLRRMQDGATVFVPLLRGATSDLNTTVALAICSVVSTQAYGVRFRGVLGQLSRYVAIGAFVRFGRQLFIHGRLRPTLLFKGALDLFVGALEAFEELTKILSFSFRLFGNVFGGEVLLAVMAFLMPYLASVPFMALELMTGLIQAFIFALLSTALFAQAAAHEGARPEEKQDQPTSSSVDLPTRA